MTSDTPSHRANTRKGFTLIELLVVIAIIAILAAILFPVFGRARENARRSTCQSNQKQIGLGILQYKQDYDEKFPVVYWNGAKWSPSIGYVNTATYPYVKSGQIYRCPSNTSTGLEFSTDPGNPGPPYAVGSPRTQYTYNSYILYKGLVPADGSPPKALMDAAIPEPSATVMMVDTNITNQVAIIDSFTFVWSPTSIRQGLHHFDGANYLYIDGHVKWHSKSTAAAHNPENCKRWGRVWHTDVSACYSNMLHL